MTAAPLYHRYPGQNKPQDAYIELDCRTGELSADWNAEVGGGVPEAVYFGHIRRFPVSCYISQSALYDLLTDPEVRALADRIIAGYIDDEGRAILTDDAHAAAYTIEARLAMSNWPEYQVQVYDADEWIGEDTMRTITAETTDGALDEIAASAQSQADIDGVMINGNIRDFLRNFRANLEEQ